MNKINMIGQKFGRLIVYERHGTDKNRNILWLCTCNCGQLKIVRASCLRSGDTKSCGCLRSENGHNTSSLNITHGHSKRIGKSRIYVIWETMIQRCTNPNNRAYIHYGGRGISICERWRKFENFIKDMKFPPTDRHQIDRIDNNSHYCPDNCQWATRKQQARNTRRNRYITFNDKTQCLSAWAEQYSMTPISLWKRLNRGWSVEKSLTTPLKKTKNG